MNIFISELKSIFTSVSAMLIIFGGSLFYLFLYPTPYYSDTVAAQKIVILDNDNTQSSRHLIFLAKSSPYLEVISVLDDPNEAQQLIETHRAYGIVMIPQDFEKHLYQRIPPVVPIMANASYLLIYGAIANAMADVIAEFNAQITFALQTHEYSLLEPELIPLFNPSMGYINYTLAPILIFILHQTLVAGAGIIGGTQNQQFSQGVRNYYATTNPLLLVLSKIFIFFCIYVVLFAFYFGFAYEFYGVHVNAHIVDFWLFSIAFIFATSAFGVCFGTLLPKRALSTQIVMLASMPIVFLLGFMWPREQIATWINDIITFLPAYSGINGLLRLNQMGASFGDIWEYFLSLLFLGVFYIFVSVVMIYKKTNRW